jgi:hypothetical protein
LEVGTSGAENLIYNSSFELGLKGYAAVQKTSVESGEIDFPEKKLEIDTTEKMWGEQSLKVNCAPKHTINVVSSEMKLTVGKSYTFSFWAKNAPGTRDILVAFSARVQNGKAVKDFREESSLTLGSDWRRYSMSFTAESEHYLFQLGTTSPREGCFWLDGLQLEEGEMTAYHPASDLEVAVYAPQKIVGTDQLDGKVTAISYNKKISSQQIALSVADSVSGKIISQKTAQLALPAGKTVNKDFSFSGILFGGSTLTATPGVPASSAFTVRLHNLPPYDPAGFQVGCNGNSLGRNIGLAGNAGAATVDTFGSPNSISADRTHLGHLHRTLGVTWRYTQPEQGRLVWDRLDRVVAEAEKNNLVLELLLTGNFCDAEYAGNHYLPDWMIQRDQTGKPEKSLLLKNETPNHMTYLPQLEDWRGYVKAVANRYKGRVAYYDLINEVNVGFPPEIYLEFLKVAAEEIRAADPKAKIVAMSATEDIGGRAAAFVKDCLALNAQQYFDYMSFHPYGSRMDDTKGTTAIQRIRMLQEIAKNAGVNKPFWNDEIYYLNSEWVGNYVLDSFWPTGSLSRRLLMDMGEGLFASTPVNIDQFYFDPTNPNRIKQTYDTNLVPSEVFAEQNTLAHFLSGAVPMRTLELNNDVLCYLFKNGSRVLGAIWGRTKTPVVLPVKAPTGGKITLYDLYGNPLKHNVKELSLDITRVPQYLEWTGCGFGEAATSFQQ